MIQPTNSQKFCMSLQGSKSPLLHAFGQSPCQRAIFRTHWGTSSGRNITQTLARRHSITASGALIRDDSFIWARVGTGAQSRRRYATATEDSAQKEIPQSPYPYPAHPSPSAHQIFHLHRGATQSQIKARCAYRFACNFHPVVIVLRL